MITRALKKKIYSLKGIQSFSSLGIDRKIEPLISTNDGFFVELGAFDGVYESNSYFYELFRNYKGVLIEPNPIAFAAMSRVRSKKSRFFNCACVDFDYVKRTTNLELIGPMSISLDLELDIQDRKKHVVDAQNHINAHWNESYRSGGEIQVIAKTLNAILNEVKAPKLIDFLSLDVEGAEMSVLKGIDYNSYRFKVIVIESRNQRKTTEYLAKRNYVLFQKVSPIDYIFVYKDLAK